MWYIDEHIVGENMGDTKRERESRWPKWDDNGGEEWGGWEIRNPSIQRCYYTSKF